MTTAILVAAAPAREGCAALLRAGGETLLARLAKQLERAGVNELLVLTKPEWAAACKEALADVPAALVEQVADASAAFGLLAQTLERTSGRTLIAQADILTHTGAIESLLKDPRIGSGVLVHAGDDGWPVRIERGRVTGASSPYHRTSGARAKQLGFLLVSTRDRAPVAAVAQQLGSLTAGALPDGWNDELRRRASSWSDERTAAAPWDLVAQLVVGVVRADVPLRCAYLRKLFWARPLSKEQASGAARAMASIDEQRVLMDSSVKAADGFFGTFFCSPYTKHIARVFARWGVRPNQVTIFSFVLGLSSALAFSFGSRAGLFAGAVLLYLTLAFDCVDGQLARFSKRYTSLGAWLDPMFDRAKEYLVIGALAAGAVKAGAQHEHAWALAGAALTLQTVRHFLDFSYAANRQRVQASARTAPLTQVADDVTATPADEVVPVTGEPDEFSEGHDAPPPGASVRAKVIGGSARMNRVPAIVWVKRIIQFPIGERYAAISITAALGSAMTVFWVLLAWGAVALAYSTAGRILRSTL